MRLAIVFHTDERVQDHRTHEPSGLAAIEAER
jgi:hypothetical protein